MNWNEIELRVFSTDSSAWRTLRAPQGDLQTLRVEAAPNGLVIKDDPLVGR